MNPNNGKGKGAAAVDIPSLPLTKEDKEITTPPQSPHPPLSPRNSSHSDSPRSPKEQAAIVGLKLDSPRKSKTTRRKKSERKTEHRDSWLLSEKERRDLINRLEEFVKKCEGSSGNITDYHACNGVTYNLIVVTGDEGTNFYLLDQNDYLGSGANSSVFKAYNLISRQTVAVKYFNLFLSLVNRKDVENEIENLKIVKNFLGASVTDESCFIFMPFFEGVPLTQFLYHLNSIYPETSPEHFEKRKQVPLLLRIKIAVKLLSVVIELHQNGLIHRDLKPDNIIIHVSKEGVVSVYLVDLGSAISIDSDSRLFSSSFGYAPPEICFVDSKDKRSFYSLQSDYYALAVILAELLFDVNYQLKLIMTLNKLRDENNKRELTAEEFQTFFKRFLHAKRTLKKREQPDVECCSDNDLIEKSLLPELIKLINSMSQKNKDKRPSCKELEKITSKLIDELKQLEKDIKALHKVQKSLQRLKKNQPMLKKYGLRLFSPSSSSGSEEVKPMKLNI